LNNLPRLSHFALLFRGESHVSSNAFAKERGFCKYVLHIKFFELSVKVK
jgi:hypothetical protein